MTSEIPITMNQKASGNIFPLYMYSKLAKNWNIESHYSFFIKSKTAAMGFQTKFLMTMLLPFPHHFSSYFLQQFPKLPSLNFTQMDRTDQFRYKTVRKSKARQRHPFHVSHGQSRFVFGTFRTYKKSPGMTELLPFPFFFFFFFHFWFLPETLTPASSSSVLNVLQARPFFTRNGFS